MNLKQIRQQFVTMSGRLDLQNSDGSDNGANFFIYNGSRYLDKLTDKKYTEGRIFKKIEKGSYGVILPSCRSILEVFIADGTKRNQLKKLEFEDFRKYMHKMPEDVREGRPIHYCVAKLRMMISQQKATIDDLASIFSYSDYVLDEVSGKSGIFLFPPSDKEYQIEVLANLYSAELDGDLSENYWSLQQPMLLLMTAIS